jgi:hypothetical protein
LAYTVLQSKFHATLTGMENLMGNACLMSNQTLFISNFIDIFEVGEFG